MRLDGEVKETINIEQSGWVLYKSIPFTISEDGNHNIMFKGTTDNGSTSSLKNITILRINSVNAA